MAQKDGSLRVAALTGSVKVVDDGTETLLAAGNAMSLAEDQPSQKDQPNQKDNRKRPAAAPVPAGTAMGTAILIGVAVAGAATAIALLTTRGGCTPVSPTGTCP